MNERQYDGKRRNRKYIIMFLLIWAVQMAAAFYFCVQKQGFHEDEYYTYYSTARTNGFYVEDGQWMDRETYRNEFVVLPGQGFQYGLVKQVQSWDVHPPVYYWVFHTVASLVPGVFSKWIGLSVNLVFWGINIVLLAYLAWLVSGRSERMAVLVTLFYGLSPAAMSGVVFIRMYEMLTTFVLLCAILHVQAMRCNGVSAKRLLPMAAVTYLGFLTQYYYFIFLFYLAVGFCIWLLWRDRTIWNCLRYGVSQGIAFALAYLTYPSCLGQMFRGQRGAQATENFFNLSNTLDRFRFFYGLLDEYVFGKFLSMFLLALLILAVTVYGQRSLLRAKQTAGKAVSQDKEPEAKQTARTGVPQDKESEAKQTSGKAVPQDLVPEAERIRGKLVLRDRVSAADQYKNRITKNESRGCCAVYTVLVFAVSGYFLTVSKTALLLGDTSNRYQLPVYGMIVLLFLQGIRMLWQRVRPEFMADADRGRYLYGAAAAVCLLIDVAGLASDRVVFLYPEDKAQTDFAVEREKEGTPVVYLYQPGAEWCIWDVTNELLAYPEIYFAAADKADKIAEERIQNAEALVVYLAKGADDEAQIERILDSNPRLSDSRLIFDEKYCRVYYMQ